MPETDTTPDTPTKTSGTLGDLFPEVVGMLHGILEVLEDHGDRADVKATRTAAKTALRILKMRTAPAEPPEPTADLREFPATMLTAEQEIRARGVAPLVIVIKPQSNDPGGEHTAAVAAVAIADVLATYISDGLTEPEPATVDDTRDPVHDRLGGSSMPS